MQQRREREEYVEALTGVELIRLGQMFRVVFKKFLQKDSPEAKAEEVEKPVFFSGFVATLPVKHTIIINQEVETKIEWGNYLFLYQMGPHLFAENEQVFARMVLLDGQHHETLIKLMNATGTVKSLMPYKPVTDQFIERFKAGPLQPANPAELFKLIKQTILFYQDVDENIAELVALWAMGTYFYMLFDSYPYLYIHGLWQSGKTKLLSLLKLLCFHASLDISVTESSIFRLSDDFGVTLLIDESDYLSDGERAQDIKRLLYARYKREGGVVLRTEGDKKKTVQHYYVYGPLAMANIGGIEQILMDRAITIILWRGRDREKMARWPSDDATFKQLRDELYVLMLTLWPRVKEIYDQLLTDNSWGLAGREWELWRPIVTMAKFVASFAEEGFGDSLLERLRGLCEKIININRDMTVDQPQLFLLKALVNLPEKNTYVSLKTLREEVKKLFDEEEWRENEKRFEHKNIGKMLRQLGFTERRRVGQGYEYYISADMVETLASRWMLRAEESIGRLFNSEGVCEYCGETAAGNIDENGRYRCQKCQNNIEQ